MKIKSFIWQVVKLFGSDGQNSARIRLIQMATEKHTDYKLSLPAHVSVGRYPILDTNDISGILYWVVHF